MTQGDLFEDGGGDGPLCDACGDPIERRRYLSVGLCHECGLKVGRARKDRAVDALKAYRSQMIAMIRSRLVRLARQRPDRLVDANDAYELRAELVEERRRVNLPVPEPEDVDLRYLAGVWKTDAFEHTGQWRASDVPDHHGKPISVWRYVGDGEKLS